MDPNFHVISATFNHTFTKFSQIRKITQSPACWIQNLPWKIFIEPGFRDKKKYLSIYVGCAAAITTNPWSCRASVRLYKLDGTRPKTVRTTKFFVFDSEASTSWGHDNFILWDTVLNPANGFIKNDSITIEVSIDAEVPVGIKLTPTYFTDERANTAIKLCDQTIASLQLEIQQLRNQKATLKKASTEEIQEIRNILRVSEKQYKDEHEVNNQLKKSINANEIALKSEKDNNDTLEKVLNEKNAEIATLTEKLKGLEKHEKEQKICKTEKNNLEQKYSSLLEEFNNYKSIYPNTESDSEDVPKSALDTMKKKYTELQTQLSLVQKELTDAKAKSLKLDEVLKNNVEKHHQEKVEMESKLASIHKELLEAKLLTKSMKTATFEDQQIKQTEKAALQSQIQSLKSQLYESLVKTNISQDTNEDTDTLKKENDRLLKQIEIEKEKLNELEVENALIKSQIQNLNKQLLNINLPQTNIQTKEIKDCRDELAQCKAKNQELQTTNNNLTKQLKESQVTKDSVMNGNKPHHEENALEAELKNTLAELKAIKDQKMDVTISNLRDDKLKLITKLNVMENEMKNKETQLLKTQNDYNKMLVLEKNTSMLQTQFNTAKNELKEIKAIKLNEFLSKLKEEGTNLTKLISALTPVSEKLDTQIHKTEIESFKDEKMGHKKSNAFPQRFQDGTKQNVQTSSSHQEGDGEQIHLNIKPGESEPVNKFQVEKPIQSSEHENFDNLEKYQKKHPIERRIESLRRQFEKEMRDSDNVLHNERESLSKKLDVLMNQLREEKHKLLESNEKQSELKGEINRLKEENKSLKELKEKLNEQIKTSQKICVETLYLILTILRTLKTSGKLSCSVEALIISNFNTLKQQNLWSLENEDICNRSDIEQVIRDISIENLQNKLVQLGTHYEESIDIIKKNYALQNNENSNLRTANKELLVVVENEIKMNKLYKEMLKIANSRLGDFRKQLTELGNQFMDEKVKRYECEETSRTLKLSSDGNELLLNDLKQKLLKHSIQLSEIEKIKPPLNSSEDPNLKNDSSSIESSAEISIEKHSDDSKDLKTNIENSVPVRIESQETTTYSVVNPIENLERIEEGTRENEEESQTSPTQETSILEDPKSPNGSDDFNTMAPVGMESSSIYPEMGSQP
ncbi:putative leucine-rich repeat-containing protein DDB_G0290503 [Harmonia axyridis]|uniref:putative leucine-rich repeat-containing protein DDB_G0290503 n=1 Tax=Harmonia axyridis TaxID=115357 RepID=UPI001E2754A1|nr:putative leucine-rich repeat-containing protein DDB_G0290503 [Harmonia axyridis]